LIISAAKLENNIKTVAMTVNNEISSVLLSCLYHCQQYTIFSIPIKCLIFFPILKKLEFFPQVLMEVQNKATKFRLVDAESLHAD